MTIKKLPRKLKKKLYGTRSQRRRLEKIDSLSGYYAKTWNNYFEILRIKLFQSLTINSPSGRLIIPQITPENENNIS